MSLSKLDQLKESYQESSAGNWAHVDDDVMVHIPHTHVPHWLRVLPEDCGSADGEDYANAKFIGLAHNMMADLLEAVALLAEYAPDLEVIKRLQSLEGNSEIVLTDNGFVYEGIEIKNPTLSSCGRFRVDPIEVYGFHVFKTGGGDSTLLLDTSDGGSIWLKNNGLSHELLKETGEPFMMGFYDKEGNEKAIFHLKTGIAPEELNQNEVKRIKETYPVGTRVRVDKMNDPHGVPVGTYGTVDLIDDAGQLHVKWDNGSMLALVPNADEFTVLTVSLEDFVASKVFTDDIEKTTGCDNGNPGTKGYVYMNSCYIEQLDDGTYYLPISRDEFASENLGELEKILYDQHFWL